MNMDSEIISGWFVISAGKVYSRCPHCHSSRIVYHKIRTPGLTGISASSKGISPACMACGKGMPTQIDKGPKAKTIIRKLRVY